MSEMEAQYDEKYAVTVILPDCESSPEEKEYEGSEAKRIREDWMRQNLERGCERGSGEQNCSEDEEVFHDALDTEERLAVE